MGNKGLFPVAPCRVLSLVLSFASKESTAPIGAEAPPSAPESARQALGVIMRPQTRAVGFPFTAPFGPPEENERPIGRQALLPRRSRRVKHPTGNFLRQNGRAWCRHPPSPRRTLSSIRASFQKNPPPLSLFSLIGRSQRNAVLSNHGKTGTALL